jgi:hypothetical protein
MLGRPLHNENSRFFVSNQFNNLGKPEVERTLRARITGRLVGRTHWILVLKAHPGWLFSMLRCLLRM